MPIRVVLTLLGVLLVGVRPVVAQVPTSTTQMQLVASATFTNRLQYLMVQQAAVVLAEAKATACHAQRLTYAFAVINSPAQMAFQASVLIASSNIGGAVIVGTVVTNADPNKVDSSATDLALTNAIVNNWNTLSRCETGL